MIYDLFAHQSPLVITVPGGDEEAGGEAESFPFYKFSRKKKKNLQKESASQII